MVILNKLVVVVVVVEFRLAGVPRRGRGCPLSCPLSLSGRKNVMSMRERFCPDPLAGFEKMAGFQIFYCLKIKCFHS